MIRLSTDGRSIRLSADELQPKVRSQLAVYGFAPNHDGGLVAPLEDATATTVAKVVACLTSSGCSFELDKHLDSILASHALAEQNLQTSKEQGRRYKEDGILPPEASSFVEFLSEHVPRQLKEHQLKAAFHSLAVGGGANFSVPGSGKTTVVLTVFEWMRKQDIVDGLFVVGPPACFGPWVTEFEEALGYKPGHERLAGGDIDTRRSKYWINRESICDLYLTSYQTLHRDHREVGNLFRTQGVRFFLVVDEAHYVKRLDGAWASALLAVSKFAERRCILTGTPFPHSLYDAFNLFDILWPDPSPVPASSRARIQVLTDRDNSEDATRILDDAIGPLFYRVRKKELDLAPQVFHDPVVVKMREHERFVYDSIVGAIRELTLEDFSRDYETVARLRRARMIRLRQCTSNASLLRTGLDDEEDVVGGKPSLKSRISCYPEVETPAKIDALIELANTYLEKDRRVVIWSNFIGTLRLIEQAIGELGVRSEVIIGEVPPYSDGVEYAASREGIIKEFTHEGSDLAVLVANPAACSESVSLHKTCSNAIYYDLSYNCAQYLQSLDRIHRVGGSEDKPAHYDFLLYEDTIDLDILQNVRTKAARMSEIIDQDYPVYSLDMFEEDDDLDAYDRLFGD